MLKSVRKGIVAKKLVEPGNPKGYYDYAEFIIHEGSMDDAAVEIFVLSLSWNDRPAWYNVFINGDKSYCEYKKE